MAKTKRKHIVNLLSVNGLHSIDRRQPLCSRTNQFWTALFLLGLTGLCFHVYTIANQYLKALTVAETEICNYEPGKVEYPAVTFCSLNPFKLSNIHHAELLNNIQAAYIYGVQQAQKNAQTRAKRSSGESTGSESEVRRLQNPGRNETEEGRNATLTENRAVDVHQNSSNHVDRQRSKRQISHGFMYFGCYERFHDDGGVIKDIFRNYKTSIDIERYAYITPQGPMSVNTCMEMCEGYLYAAVTEGYICMCSMWLQGVTLVSTTGCDTQCEDATKTVSDCSIYMCPFCNTDKQCCGGTDVISVYEATGFTASSKKGYFEGCFPADPTDPNMRDRANFLGTSASLAHPEDLPAGSVDVASCQRFCGGYTYAAIIGSDKCMCGDYVYYKPTAVDESECNTPCASGELKANCAEYGCDKLTSCGEQSCCGGTNRMAVYRVRGCRADQTNSNTNYDHVTAVHGETIAWGCADGFDMQNDNPATVACSSDGYSVKTADAPTCVFTPATIPFWYMDCYERYDVDGKEILSHISTIKTSYVVSAGSTVQAAIQTPMVGMSVSACLEMCRGYNYAALTGGNKCICTMWLPGPLMAITTGCTTTCEDTSRFASECVYSADPTLSCPACSTDKQCCGGNEVMSLYMTDYLPLGATDLFEGCFPSDPSDPSVGHRINYLGTSGYLPHPEDLPAESVDVSSCQRFCAGYYYAAIIDSDKCMCADHVGYNPLEVDESECNVPCASGEPKIDCVEYGCDKLTSCGAQTCCGGTNRMALYRVRGCFVSHPNSNTNYDHVSVLLGRSISWGCADGFELQADNPATATCDRGYTYPLFSSEPPTCAAPMAMSCTLPSLVISGYDTPSGETLQGRATNTQLLTFNIDDSVSFACDYPELSVLDGADTINCLAGGWDEPIPACVERTFNTTVEELPLDFDIDLLSEAQQQVFEDTLDMFEMTGGNSSDPAQISEVLLVQARRSLQKSIGETTDADLDAVSFAIEELLISCNFDSRQCNYSDFQTVRNNIYGNCFVFNWNATQFSRHTSLHYALRARMRSSDLLFTTDSIGARLAFDEPGLYPLPETNGITLSNGFHYVLGFRKEAVDYVTDCRSDWNDDSTVQTLPNNIYPDHYTYSKDTCYRSCIANYVHDICKCTDGRLPKPPNATVPACREDNSCYTQARSYAATKCSCERSCRFVHYRSTVTSSAFPIRSTELESANHCDSDLNSSCKEQIGNSVVMIDILPTSQFYEHHTETLVYELADVYHQVSNAVCMWIGLSWIGLTELIIAIIEQLWYRCFRSINDL